MKQALFFALPSFLSMPVQLKSAVVIKFQQVVGGQLCNVLPSRGVEDWGQWCLLNIKMTQSKGSEGAPGKKKGRLTNVIYSNTPQRLIFMTFKGGGGKKLDIQKLVNPSVTFFQISNTPNRSIFCRCSLCSIMFEDFEAERCSEDKEGVQNVWF